MSYDELATSLKSTIRRLECQIPSLKRTRNHLRPSPPPSEWHPGPVKMTLWAACDLPERGPVRFGAGCWHGRLGPTLLRRRAEAELKAAKAALEAAFAKEAEEAANRCRFDWPALIE